VREPRTRLASIHAELLQPCLETARKSGRLTALVCEDEHAHRARLAVAQRLELERSALGNRSAQRSEDRVELASRSSSEKSKGDVKALDRAAAGEMLRPPLLQSSRDVSRQLECEEEPKCFPPWIRS